MDRNSPDNNIASPPHDNSKRATPAANIHWAWLLGLTALLLGSQATLSGFSARLDHVLIHQPQVALLVMTLLIIPAAALFFIIPSAPPSALHPHLLAAMIGVGVLMRVIHFGAGAIAETDHFRYLWDGAVLSNGFNPYATSPQDAASGAAPHLQALARQASEILRNINFPEYRTIYPATAQIAFALGHKLLPWSLDGIRIVMFIAESATLVLLFQILKERRANLLWAAAYWLNPLVVIAAINQVHVDALIPPLLLGALLSLWRRQAITAAVLLALAAGVKIWPLLLVPLAIRTIWPDRTATMQALLAGIIATSMVMAPVLLSTTNDGSGLAAYAQGWAMNNPFYLWITWALWATTPASIPSDAILRASLSIASAAIALNQARQPPTSLSELLRRAMIVSAAIFYLSPTEFPWYALWFMPLATVMQCRPLLLASVTLPLYYAFFPLAEAGIRHWYHYGLSFAHGVPVLVWIAWSQCWRQTGRGLNEKSL